MCSYGKRYFTTHVSRLKDLDGDLISVSGLNETLQVSTRRLVRHPAGLLSIIRLALELGLEGVGDIEPLARIRVRPGALLDMAGHVSAISLAAKLVGEGGAVESSFDGSCGVL